MKANPKRKPHMLNKKYPNKLNSSTDNQTKLSKKQVCIDIKKLPCAYLIKRYMLISSFNYMFNPLYKLKPLIPNFFHRGFNGSTSAREALLNVN